MTLLPEHYPYWAKGLVGPTPVKAVQLFAQTPAASPTSVNLYGKADKSGASRLLAQDPTLGNLLSGSLPSSLLPAVVTDAGHPALSLYFDDNSMEDLWLAVTWPK